MGKKRITNSETKQEIGLKIRFFIISLWLLFVLIFLLTVDIPISFAPDAKFIGFAELFRRNVLSTIALVCAIVSWGTAKHMQYQWKGVTNPPYKIKAIKNENYEYLTFLTTYIIPLICIDFGNIRYIIVLVVLLIIIGYIFVKMDLYYGNPTLALMGYRLYRAEIEGLDVPDGVVLITKDRLTNNAAFKWIKIDDFVWVAKEVKENEHRRTKDKDQSSGK